MPIQELLTGVTFPSPTINVNTIPNPLTYLGSQLQLWLEANAGITNDGTGAAAYDGDGNVSAWADQSGNGRNLVQYQSNPIPPFVASAQNGLPGVQSNASANATCPYLRSAYASGLDFAASTPFSVAFKPGTSGDNIMGTYYSSAQGWYVSLVAGKPALRICNSATVQCAASGSSALTLGTPYIVQLVNTGTGTAAGLQIYVNNVLQTNTVIIDNLAGAVTQNGTYGVAAPAIFSGNSSYESRATILEMGVASKAFSAHDAAIIDAYLNAKWAIHA